MNRIHLWGIFIVFALFTSGCSDDSSVDSIGSMGECKSKHGCLNDNFIELFESNCENMENGCSTSFKEMFGGADRVYFADVLNIWFSNCETIPFSERIKEDATEMCRYIFFEKEGEIEDYLRCWCLSDSNNTGMGRIDFDAHLVGMVSIMDGSADVHISRTTQGNHFHYHIALNESELSEYSGDTCIHSP